MHCAPLQAACAVVLLAGLPARVARLQKEIAWILKRPETSSRIAHEGSHAVGNTASEFSQTIRAESAKWSALIRKAAIRAE